MKVEASGVYRKSEEIIESALAGGCRSISYTYVEPTVFFEYAYDCCLAAFAKGLKNIFVSNGYMTKEIIVKLAPVLTAINIDLKSFSDEFYKKICGAKVQPVLDNIVGCREAFLTPLLRMVAIFAVCIVKMPVYRRCREI